MPVKYSAKERDRAVRLVVDHRDDYASEWEAIRKVASRLGVSAESLRRWVRQGEDLLSRLKYPRLCRLG